MMEINRNELQSNEVEPQGVVLHRGAEAILMKGKWLGVDAIYKIRTKKAYRIPMLDEKIRFERTVTEARVLVSLLEARVPVPTLFDVNLKKAIIVMEHVVGAKLKDVIEKLKGNFIPFFSKVGFQVARIHELDIIHGDLTTSNIILTRDVNDILNKENDDIPFKFIDFGLARHTASVEDKSVDLHLFKRVITSTHASHYDEIFPPFMDGYKDYLHERGLEAKFRNIDRRLNQIETRGRYVEKLRRN